jgi:hypothetical protein
MIRRTVAGSTSATSVDVGTRRMPLHMSRHRLYMLLLVMFLLFGLWREKIGMKNYDFLLVYVGNILFCIVP